MKNFCFFSSQVHNYLLALLFINLLILPGKSISQNIELKERKKAHFEIPDDKYQPIDRNSKSKSLGYQYKSSLIYTTQVNVDNDGNNILGDAANEPSIAIDPTNPNRMMIGWRQFDDVGNNFRQAGYGYSIDGGDSWVFPGVIDAGVFRSDPVLDTDKEGNFYYNSLTADDDFNFECKVFRTESDNFEWDEGVYAQGGDKQWMTIDKTNGTGSGHNYSFWSWYVSACDDYSFTRSTDYGDSYEDCISVSGDPVWGTLTVGKEGELYVAGAGSEEKIIITKSLNASNPAANISWSEYKEVNLDGKVIGSPPINPQGLAGQVWVDTDRSNGAGSGNVYILASVQRNSNSDPLDVMFTRSTDGGTTWSEPIKINDDSSIENYQWLATLSVAPNGRLDAIWLDTRDPGDTEYHSALYYSFSIDEGNTWSVNEKLSDSFDPKIGYPNQEKMGDYFEMISDNEYAHLAWANTLNGEQDVYYSRISHGNVGTQEEKNNVQLSMNIYPNPTKGLLKLSYSLDLNADVNIQICDLYGNIIKSFQLQNQSSGLHSRDLNLTALPNGIYICKLKTNDLTISRRIVLLD